MIPKRYQGLAVFLYGFAVAALFAFVIYGRQGLVAATVDLNCFGQLSRNLLAGDGFSYGNGPTIRRAPLYPLLGYVLLLVAGRDPAAYPDAVFYRPLLIANCVIFGFTCRVVWGIAKKLFGSRTAWIAVAICPFVPHSLRYVGMTEVETLMGLFIALLAATSLAVVEKPNVRTGAAFGLTAAAATLTKPIVLLFPALLLPAALFHWAKSGAPRAGRIAAIAVAGACFILPLVPWSLRNAAATGGQFRGISSNGPGEFLRGYVNAQTKYAFLQQDFGGNGPGQKWDPEANEMEEQLLTAHGMPFYRPAWDANGKMHFDPAPPPGMTTALVEAQKDALEGAEMKRRLKSEPFGFVRKFAVQVLTFWYVAETRVKSAFVGVIALVFLALAGRGVLLAVRRGSVVWPVPFVLLYFNLIYAAFLAFARYSMPLYPTLIVLAAAPLAELSRRLPFRWAKGTENSAAVPDSTEASRPL